MQAHLSTHVVRDIYVQRVLVPFGYKAIPRLWLPLRPSSCIHAVVAKKKAPMNGAFSSNIVSSVTAMLAPR